MQAKDNQKSVHDPTQDLEEQRAVSKCTYNDLRPAHGSVREEPDLNRFHSLVSFRLPFPVLDRFLSRIHKNRMSAFCAHRLYASIRRDQHFQFYYAPDVHFLR